MLQLLFTLLLSFFLMGMVWLAFKMNHRAEMLNLSRPVVIFILGFTHLAFLGWDNLSISVFYMLLFWAIYHIIFELRHRYSLKCVDTRFTILSADWKDKNEGFIQFFCWQAVYMWVLTLPFYFIGKRDMAAISDVVLMIFIFVSMIGTVAAGMTLQKYKERGGKEVCTDGFWGLSRHPNYFFEWLTWVGFSLMAYHDLLSILAIMSPIIMLAYFFSFLIPLTEKYCEKSYGHLYKKYQAEISMFFPKPKRRTNKKDKNQ